MSYNNKEDDVIVFDPFDDEAYNKWLKARQESLKNGELQKREIASIEFPVEKPEPVVLLPHLAQKPPEKKPEPAKPEPKKLPEKDAAAGTVVQAARLTVSASITVTFKADR